MLLLQVDSPLVPSVYEYLLTLGGLIHLVLFFIILFWLPRQSAVAPSSRIIGLLVAFLVPILGPLVIWIVVRQQRDSSDNQP